MKELSIEEKARAYDEALEIARQYWNDRAMPIGTNFKLERMFPELRESKDERIRKAIVKMISDIDGGSPFEKYGITKKEALAWLEKQGEQKPTDKPEPKFKVGNWIIYKDNIWKICNISLGIYYELLKINNEVSIRHFEGVDKTAHLWTIQDVKDGDVLVLNNEVFIYAHRKQMYSIAVAHCFVDSAGSFYLDGEFGYKECGKTISPATKEQRDLLFSKMKEAGYEWDSHTNKIIYNNDYRRLR